MCFITIILMCGTLAIPLSKNPIYSVISFIIIIICFGLILFLILNQELLGLILVIVYAGAISIVFLFVIMMLNIRIIEISRSFWGFLPLSFLFLFFLLYQLFFNISSLILSKKMSLIVLNYLPYKVEIVSKAIQLIFEFTVYNYYSFWIILIALILLIAMLGSIVLTFNKKVKGKQQFILKQSVRQGWRIINQKCLY